MGLNPIHCTIFMPVVSMRGVSNKGIVAVSTYEDAGREYVKYFYLGDDSDKATVHMKWESFERFSKHLELLNKFKEEYEKENLVATEQKYRNINI